MLSPELSLRHLHSTTACTARWSFCDSGFAIMVLKAPSEPSGSQELQARLAAPGSHGTHPPSHSHSACSLACTHACTLRRRIAIPALACSSALHSYWHARAGAAAAVQLLRSHTPQPAHGALAMVVLFRAKNGSCMHACTLRRRNAVPALACSSALRSYLLACTRTRVPPPHCSSCARMLLSPPMAGWIGRR